MMMAKIAVVTRISARVKPRCRRLVSMRRSVMAGLLLPGHFRRVEKRVAAAARALRPRDVGAHLRELRGGPWLIWVERGARGEDDPDPRVGEDLVLVLVRDDQPHPVDHV